MVNEHISKQFDSDLETIRSKVLAMGGMVEHQFQAAIKAFVHGNNAAAEQVIRDDAQVNLTEVTLDQLCIQLIMRRQPTANDLRTVFASIKMITDLERVGDESSKIARHAIHIHKDGIANQQHLQAIEQIGQKAIDMLQSALDAYARLDVEQAMRLITKDDDLDAEFRQLVKTLVNDMPQKDKSQIKDMMDVLWAVKSIERIGDHAKNLGEYVVYIVEGKDIRHAHITLEGQ